MELIKRAEQHAERIAVVDENGSYTYAQLLERSAAIAGALLGDAHDLNEARVCFLVAPGFNYVATQWGIWRAGGIAVPMGLVHPVPELQYILDMTGCETVVCEPQFEERALEAATDTARVHLVDSLNADSGKLPNISLDRKGLILFTSGTTSRPKGVVSTHLNIQSQITCLIDAWEWTQDDVILNVLPLHHTHGIINVVCCAMWSGATCEFFPKFDAEKLWERFMKGGLTLFMAVPTIYKKLLDYWESQSEARQSLLSPTTMQFRLNVSGSAALPVSVLEFWKLLGGQVLLERYGMTEIGMALSNPYGAERRAGTVGQPLPGVEIRLVDEDLNDVEPGQQGEILVKGANVFLEYWKNPTATAEAFVDGWFRTGDMAIVDDGYYRILGRSSVDIIKTGGYKVSALEVEEVLRTHDAVADCAVVGIPDGEWGEKVVAAVVPSSHSSLTTEEAAAFLKDRLAPYKLTRAIVSVEKLPRNVLGKVLKADVKKLFTK